MQRLTLPASAPGDSAIPLLRSLHRGHRPDAMHPNHQIAAPAGRWAEPALLPVHEKLLREELEQILAHRRSSHPCDFRERAYLEADRPEHPG
jgi:hypothetical protein